MRKHLISTKRFISVLIAVFLLSFSVSVSASEQYETDIAIGMQLLNEGKSSEALKLLGTALVSSPDNTEAIYYAGIANSRLGNYKEAEEQFLRALELDGSIYEAYLEIGRLNYIVSECDRSNDYLSKFIELSDDQELTEYASGLMDTCLEEVRKRPFHLEIALGWQYDANVIAEPTNPTINNDRKRDMRFLYYLSGGATLLDIENLSLAADYALYQSQHLHLSGYNVQHHKFSPEIKFKRFNSVIPSIGYSLEYMRLGKELYGNISTYSANILLTANKSYPTELSYEYKDRKYWDSDLFPVNSERNGYKHAIGVRQDINKDNVSYSGYLLFDYDRAVIEYWSYNGYKGGVEINYRVSPPLNLSFKGDYHKRTYQANYPSSNLDRLDRMQEYSIETAYMFTDNFAASISNMFTINDSNLDSFNYNRNVTSIFISMGVL